MLQERCQEEVELILSKSASNADSLSKTKGNHPLRVFELPSARIEEALRSEDFWITPVLGIMQDFIDTGHDTGALKR